MATILPHGKQSRKYRPTKVRSQFVGQASKPLLEGGAIQKIGEKMYLVVTDGRVAVRLPVSKQSSNDEITEGYIPGFALPFMERARFDLTPDSVILGGRTRARLVKGEWVEGEPVMQFSRIEPGKSSDDEPTYPLIEKKWPALPRRTLKVSLDPKLLRRLADGLAADALTLEIDLDQFKLEGSEGEAHYEQPLVVYKYGSHSGRDSGAVGLVMPMRESIAEQEPESE